MVYCKKCVHCEKVEKDAIEYDGRIISMWMCYCIKDGIWREEEDDSKCPEYIEDKTL